MSYKNLVESNVSRAFELLKDLAKTVVLQKKASGSFDFNTGTAASTLTNVSVKAVVVDGKKHRDRKTIQSVLMVKTADVGDIKAYDKVTVDGVIWNVGDVPKDGGFVTVANLYREP